MSAGLKVFQPLCFGLGVGLWCWPGTAWVMYWIGTVFTDQAGWSAARCRGREMIVGHGPVRSSALHRHTDFRCWRIYLSVVGRARRQGQGPLIQHHQREISFYPNRFKTW